jgi:hypothetical protein
MAALPAIPPPANEPEAIAERRSLLLLNQEQAGTQLHAQDSDQSNAFVAAYWPAAPQPGNVSSASPTDPSSVNDPSQSTNVHAARNPDRPPEPGSANARSPGQKAPANDSTTKPPEKVLPGRYGRVISNDFLLREEKGAALSPFQRERPLSPVGQSFSSEEVTHGQGRGNRLSHGPPEEASSGVLVGVLSPLTSDFSMELSSCRVGVKGGLNAKAVERLSSSREGGLLDSLLPATEEIVFAKQWEELPQSYRQALRELGSPFERATQLPRMRAAEAGNEISVPPWYLSVVLYRPSGKPLDPSAQQGLERLCAYAWYSIHNAERIHGEKLLNPEDVVRKSTWNGAGWWDRKRKTPRFADC